MRIYEVMSINKEEDHVVIAKSATEAINAMVKHLNQFQTHDLYKTSDFCASAIGADKFSEPTIIV